MRDVPHLVVKIWDIQTENDDATEVSSLFILALFCMMRQSHFFVIQLRNDTDWKAIEEWNKIAYIKRM